MIVHELTIAEALVNTAAQEAKRAGATSVGKLICRIGVLRQVDDWTLTNAFEIASCGTICQGAELSIEKTFMHVYCPHCALHSTVNDWERLCPSCGSVTQYYGGGDELDLITIEACANEEPVPTYINDDNI